LPRRTRICPSHRKTHVRRARASVCDARGHSDVLDHSVRFTEAMNFEAISSLGFSFSALL
jgi:hypothetical protein